MTALVRPRQTLMVLQSILDDALDKANRLELTIAELESAVADAANDWSTQAAMLRLVAARDDQRRLIREAGETMRRVETLRQNAEMDASVLARVFKEYSK